MKIRSCLFRGCATSIVLLLLVAVLFVGLVGPWPAYGPGSYATASYYTDALSAIDTKAAETHLTDTPGTFQAGWNRVSITPEVGLPLGGYGARKGAASTSVHDDIHVKAIAVSDGVDTAVLVSSDLLIVSPNVAELVREQVAQQTPLTANDILFSATHTHSGPAGYIPGALATLFGGAYVEGLPEFLAGRFTEAIVAAYNDLAPAEIATGHVSLPDFIRNRSREAPTDANLDFAVMKRSDGRVLYMTRYSAHSTVIGADSLAFSRDYSGYLEDALERQTGGDAYFFGGAVGSMGPRAPEGSDGFAKAEAMGEGIAAALIPALNGIEFENAVDVAAIGIPVTAPPFQMRLFSPNWRLSPFIIARLGLTRDTWLETVRIGDVIISGTPCDFSGELSLDMRAWAAQQGYTLWATSFNGAYIGYLSPDRYYGDLFDEKGELEYETGAMSWAGPDQEAFYTSLMKHAANAVTPENLE